MFLNLIKNNSSNTEEFKNIKFDLMISKIDEKYATGILWGIGIFI